MKQLHEWCGSFWKKSKTTKAVFIKNKFDLKMMTDSLEHSFNSKNFDAFIEVVSKLTEEATVAQNSQAMQLLTYLKQQSKAAYRDVICDPSKLSSDVLFTREDFEILAKLYSDQRAAKNEELVNPFV